LGKVKKINMSLNWTTYCAINLNRNQCSKENCLYFNICKIKNMPNEKYEYKIIRDTLYICKEALNNFGDGGWELCAVTIDSQSEATAYLKRKIT